MHRYRLGSCFNAIPRDLWLSRRRGPDPDIFIVAIDAVTTGHNRHLAVARLPLLRPTLSLSDLGCHFAYTLGNWHRRFASFLKISRLWYLVISACNSYIFVYSTLTIIQHATPPPQTLHLLNPTISICRYEDNQYYSDYFCIASRLPYARIFPHLLRNASSWKSATAFKT